MNDAARVRIAKLLALARRGVGGEKVNAQAALEAFLRRHNMTLDDLSDDQRQQRRYPYRGPIQRKLLVQIIVMVCGRDRELYVPRNRASAMIVEVTKEEHVEIEMAWEIHRPRLQEEIKILVKAYIHKQRLFPCGEEKDDGPELTPEQMEEIWRIAQMMQGIQRVRVRKEICA